MTKLALFSAGVQADNSGDSIIESAVRRLVGHADIHRFPLTMPLTEGQIDQINCCDVAVICGTNLYQDVFACNLTEAVIDRIRIPLIPFGIGSSAPMGRIPRMDAAGVAAVRAIHKKCAVGSVRDEASFRFLRSLGIRNIVLTGCPVLFHGLKCPDFNPSGEGYTLTPRARLLHIDQRWQDRQFEALDLLSRRYRPKLILQSPYDLEVSEALAAKYGLEMIYDHDWQAQPYIEAAQQQDVSLGFRLHFAMLSIAYGKPAFLVSHDSRADEFCKLVGLPRIRIDEYSDAFLNLKIDSRDFPADIVRTRWRELAVTMRGFIAANGLDSNLQVEAPSLTPRSNPLRRKPRIGILADRPGWAYDNSMQQIRERLADEFEIDVKYVSRKPKLDPSRYDLLHVCFWGETYHQAFNFDPERVLKEVSSHRWQFDPPYGPIRVEEMADRFLTDSDTLMCTSLRLLDAMAATDKQLYHTPNGADVKRFRTERPGHGGPLIFGWAGTASDPLKGFSDIVEPACQGRAFFAAKGEVRHSLMHEFFRKIDVYIVASRHEGEPLTLIEAMGAGCFPVCSDVGIVRELIRHGENGYIVTERTAQAFRAALDWCESNREKIFSGGRENAEMIGRERNWDVCAQFFARAYKETLNRVERPKFRNDDVSWDSSLDDLKRFSAAFHRHGQVQIHGITLNGRTNTAYRLAEVATEYEGEDTISRLSNDRIRELSKNADIRERTDLIAWLNQSPDELALHGLYHTDYSKMSLAEQDRDMGEGLARMRQLFPLKRVRYFIAPFNRTNKGTYAAAAKNGLTVVAAEGVHLEADLERFEVRQKEWYRYHHHRFYPDSKFDFWKLSIEKLDAALSRCLVRQPRYLNLKMPARPGARRSEEFWNRLKDSRFGMGLRSAMAPRKG